MARFTIEGAESLIKTLESLGKLDGVEGVIAKSAKELEAVATQNTPVDKGALRRSISKRKVDPRTFDIGYTMSYAPHVEFGHRKRGGKGYVSGQYFLRRSVNEYAPRYVENLLDFVKGKAK